MFRVRRKNRYAIFPPEATTLTDFLLGFFFFLGFLISLGFKVRGVAAYLGSWALSYIVIYTGTCRRCVYYGRRCPIPLEGSCVHYFLKKGTQPFGYSSLFWATLAYLLRILIPSFAIAYFRRLTLGMAYFGCFVLFWTVHLWVSGCPNCININCPLNPDYTKR